MQCKLAFVLFLQLIVSGMTGLTGMTAVLHAEMVHRCACVRKLIPCLEDRTAQEKHWRLKLVILGNAQVYYSLIYSSIYSFIYLFTHYLDKQFDFAELV